MRKLVLALALTVGLSVGCRSTGDVQLPGNVAKAFRDVTGHRAIALSENTVIYGTENPPGPCLVAHENEHKAQAAVIGDALVAIGAIDDDDESRMAAWLMLYTLDAAQYGYRRNRWEEGARAAAREVCE